MSNPTRALKRPIAGSVAWFVMWSAGLLIASTTIDRLLQGRGLSGMVEAVFGFAWLGWIAVLAGIPFWLIYRWLLAKYGPYFSGPVRWRVAAVGLVFWAGLGLAILSIELVTWPFSPDSHPSVQTVLSGVLAIGLFGSVLGFLEGRAIERQSQGSGQPSRDIAPP